MINLKKHLILNNLTLYNIKTNLDHHWITYLYLSILFNCYKYVIYQKKNILILVTSTLNFDFKININKTTKLENKNCSIQYKSQILKKMMKKIWIFTLQNFKINYKDN